MRKIDEKISVFADKLSADDIDNIVEETENFALVQEKDRGGMFKYKIFDDSDILVAKWSAVEDCLSMSFSKYQKSYVRRVFLNVIKQEKSKKAEIKKASYYGNKSGRKSLFDDDDDYYDYDDFKPGRHAYPATTTHNYVYTEPKKSTGFLDKLNKSDTLVIHCKDATTEMLCQIYDGKNWDVLRDGNIDKEELHELLKKHDKIICLGHGTPSGLINRNGGGFTIGYGEAEYLKEKKLFIIWCNASAFAKVNNLHGFITGNMPSDCWEAASVGFDVGKQYMDDNITYWSKCCANYVDQALSGDYEGAAKNIRKDYLAVYGDETKWTEAELGITHYNAERTTAI